MISVKFFKANDAICGFEVKNHGKSIVCAAVSALTINAANSIELFSDDKFALEIENENYIKLLIEKEPEKMSREARVLLNSFELGINSINNSYKNQIDISVEAWEV